MTSPSLNVDYPHPYCLAEAAAAAAKLEVQEETIQITGIFQTFGMVQDNLLFSKMLSRMLKVFRMCNYSQTIYFHRTVNLAP